MNKKRKIPGLLEFTNYLSSPGRILWVNFLAGTARSLGFVFGLAVLVAIAAYIMGHILTNIPWIGEFFQYLDQWMRENLATYSKYAK